MGYLWGCARLADVALREGNLAEAHQMLVDVIKNFQEDRNKHGLAFALEKLVSLYVVIDRPELAASLIGWVNATREEIGDPRQRLQQDELDRDIAAIKYKMGPSAFKIAYNKGRKLTLDEAVALVR